MSHHHFYTNLSCFRLRKELNGLQESLNTARDSYSRVPEQQKVNVSSLKELPVLDRFFLNDMDASYHLTLELETSIDMIMLQERVFSPIFCLLLQAERCTFGSFRYEG